MSVPHRSHEEGRRARRRGVGKGEGGWVEAANHVRRRGKAESGGLRARGLGSRGLPSRCRESDATAREGGPVGGGPVGVLPQVWGPGVLLRWAGVFVG